ncbi:MAG: ABC transporter substrate-binding protein [Desulfobacterales bacterium]|nr:ABC transporter substrate-binding protein [Desulfobacterales bacterium]
MSIVDHLILGIALPTNPVQDHVAQDFETDIHSFPMNSWEQLSTGLKCGDINAAFVDVSLAMDLFDHELELALLMFTHRGGSRVIAPASTKRIGDFRGKSVLIPHSLSVQHMLLHKLMDARGLHLKDAEGQENVRSETAYPSLMPQMMEQDLDGDIAAFMCPAPFGNAGIEDNTLKCLLNSQALWPNHPGSAFVVHKDLLKTQKQPLAELLKRFFQSAQALEGCRQSDTLTHDSIPHLAGEFLKQPANKAVDTIRTTGVSFSPETLVPAPDLLDIVQSYMGGTMGVLKGTTDLDNFVKPTIAQTTLSELKP